MDSRSLELFLNLSETLHFGRTSEACHISPSALSRSIKHLEEVIGTELFIRDNRSVELTPQGKEFQSFARETLQNWNNIKDSLQKGRNELQGSISIYCSVTASYSFLYDVLSEFRMQHPKIELKLHTGDAAKGITRVANEQEDIAIVAKPDLLPTKLAFKRIAVSPLVFIAPSSNFNIPTSEDDWLNTPMILPEEGLGRERAEQWFKKINAQPPIYAQVAGHEALVSMVSLGFGVGIVPKIVLDNSPLAKKVKSFTQGKALGNYDVGLCTLKKRLKNPIINAFWGN